MWGHYLFLYAEGSVNICVGLKVIDWIGLAESYPNLVLLNPATAEIIIAPPLQNISAPLLH